MRGIVAAFVAAMVLVVPTAIYAGDATTAEIEALKQDIEQLRRKLRDSNTMVAKSSVDKAMDSKYGPDASVSTRQGKLTMGGLVQVWYYSIQNDNTGLFQDKTINDIDDTNEALDNDSFRIRRAELNFTMEIHENVTAYVMIDAAREATSYPDLNGGFKRRNQVAPEFDFANGVGGDASSVTGVQFGAGAVPNLLQDALINFHGVVPHHDFTVGQYLPMFSEEDFRPNGMLDFVERSFIGNRFARDLGVTIHGSWWGDCERGGPYLGAGDDGRFQYWFSAFNGAGNYHQSGGQSQNRSDDNDEKDLLATIMIRPLWKNEDWGSLEFGYSAGMGWHGEAAGADPSVDGAPVNGLNRNSNYALRHSGWASWHAGGPARGLWLKGEWQYVKDRNAPGAVMDLADPTTPQFAGNTFSSTGWYAAAGYRLSDSQFCDSVPGWLKPFEFAVRYQVYENVEVGDLVNPQTKTDNFKTRMFTGGINYYIKGHNAKIQLNYNHVDNPDADNAGRNFNRLDNDSMVVNFQVAF